MKEDELFFELSKRVVDMWTLFNLREKEAKKWWLNWDKLMEMDMVADALRTEIRDIQLRIIAQYAGRIICVKDSK